MLNSLIDQLSQKPIRELFRQPIGLELVQLSKTILIEYSSMVGLLPKAQLAAFQEERLLLVKIHSKLDIYAH